jgi:thioredoxin reductase (NADPH)
MVTAEEIGPSEVLAPLDAEGRERLFRAAADIDLAPGEGAAPEGSKGALLAVLEGRIEPVKLVDGIARVVGEPLPGEMFGEVPLALGTVFPGSFFRAAERARVLRVKEKD